MYGSETEIFVHTFQKNGKTQNLAAEKGGRNTIDNPLRFKLPQNIWYLVAGEVIQTSAGHEKLPIVVIAMTADQRESS